MWRAKLTTFAAVVGMAGMPGSSLLMHQAAADKSSGLVQVNEGPKGSEELAAQHTPDHRNWW